MSNDEGYCLISMGYELYYKLCRKMILNIRKYDTKRPICVFYDNDDLLKQHIKSINDIDQSLIYTVPFDSTDTMRNLKIEICNFDILNEWTRYGLIPKLFHPLQSPFKSSIFLDVDMIINNDFQIFWNYLNNCTTNFLFAGLSDKKNRSPPSWHWGSIYNVINSSGLNIPQLSTTIFVYKNLRDNELEKKFFTKLIKTILSKCSEWRVRSLFRESIPDEIVYACYCGFLNIRPNSDLFYFMSLQNGIEIENKQV
jgi:hypothetical protein